jgi:hypothetical protein
MEMCPYKTYCPEGGGSPPIGGTKPGDMWSPMSDGPNRWVQVGMWSGQASNTCLGHHQIAGGVHGDPAWGQDGSRHGFMKYILCCPLGWDSGDGGGTKRDSEGRTTVGKYTLIDTPVRRAGA